MSDTVESVEAEPIGNLVPALSPQPVPPAEENPAQVEPNTEPEPVDHKPAAAPTRKIKHPGAWGAIEKEAETLLEQAAKTALSDVVSTEAANLTGKTTKKK